MEEQFIHFPVRAEMELHPEALKLVEDEGSALYWKVLRMSSLGSK
jgi:hypothetical protein